MEKKICSSCHQEKEITEFYLKSKNTSRRFCTCKDCLKISSGKLYQNKKAIRLEQTRRWRRENPERNLELSRSLKKRTYLKRKNILLEISGKHCLVCGYKKSTAALEFHHKNPKIKTNSISQLIIRQFNQALEEVKDCVTLCSNCHKEYHAGLITLAIPSAS